MASLARPSPSSTTRIRRGMPSLRAIASGATTSGGATMAPEQEADGPRQPDQIMRRGGDREGGEDHAADRQQDDRAEVEFEFAPAHGDARRIDQRRQHHQQHQFGRQFQRRHARHEGQHDAGQQQQDRRRDIDSPRQQGGTRQHGEQDQKDLKFGFHGGPNSQGNRGGQCGIRPCSAAAARRSVPRYHSRIS